MHTEQHSHCRQMSLWHCQLVKCVTFDAVTCAYKKCVDFVVINFHLFYFLIWKCETHAHFKDLYLQRQHPLAQRQSTVIMVHGLKHTYVHMYVPMCDYCTPNCHTVALTFDVWFQIKIPTIHKEKYWNLWHFAALNLISSFNSMCVCVWVDFF